MLSKAYDEVQKEMFVADGHWVLGETAASPKPSARQEYYNVGGIEVIDYIKAKLTPEQYKGYLLGNIYKYSGRCQHKGEYEKDVTKLAQYVNWLMTC